MTEAWHGTNSDITAADLTPTDPVFDDGEPFDQPGVWFTTDRAFAAYFGEHVLQVTLDLAHPDVHEGIEADTYHAQDADAWTT